MLQASAEADRDLARGSVKLIQKRPHQEIELWPEIGTFRPHVPEGLFDHPPVGFSQSAGSAVGSIDVEGGHEFANRAGQLVVSQHVIPACDPGDPAVVLLDIKMPRMNGLDVLTAMRADEKLRRIPVVILSSSREESDLARSWDLGVNAYVIKPVDVDQFFEAVRTLGRFWAVLNQLPEQE